MISWRFAMGGRVVVGRGEGEGDLIFCGRCLKFQPSAAYDTFLYEQMMLKKYNEGFQKWGEEIIDL
jgi:hypothetical protein